MGSDDEPLEDPWRTLPGTALEAASATPANAPSIAALLADLSASPLLSAEQRVELQVHLKYRFRDAVSLVKELARRGWLTSFQAQHLLENRAQGLVLGPYVLLDRLGEGGMGQVFKARHQVMKRVVALKVIRKGVISYAEQVDRFQREIEIVAQLAHPNIVVAHDAGRVGDVHFFAMQFLEGADLARRLKDGALAIDKACDYAHQTALGLQHAHERALVHRDIKPNNLLICQAEPGSAREVVKILDLGLARIQYDAGNRVRALTQIGGVMGTPDYIAPEQTVDASRVDIRADIYSLGCTLYHALAGRPPFLGSSLAEKLKKHRHAEPTPIGAVREVPKGLAEVLAKMMAKPKEDRYQTPKEVAAALQPFCGEPPGIAIVATAITASAPTVLITREPELAESSPPAAQVSELRNTIPVPSTTIRRRLLIGAGGAGLVLVGLFAAVFLLAALLAWQFWPQPLGPPVPVPDEATFNPRFLDALDRAKIPVEDRFEWQPKQLVAILGQHRVRGPVTAISPDTRVIAAIDASNNKVCVGDSANLSTGRILPLGFAPTALAISNDQILAISSADDKTVRLLNPKTREEIAKLEGHDDVPRHLAFLESKRLLVATSRTLWIWDLDKSKIIHELPGHKGHIVALAVSGNGKRALSAEGKGDGTLRFWDLEAGQPLRVFSRNVPDKAEITGVAITHDGGKVAVGHSDLSIHLWDPAQMVERGKIRESTTPWDAKSIHALKTRPWPPASLAFSQDGKRLAASVYVAVNLFDLDAGGSWRQIDKERLPPPSMVAFLAGGPKGRLLVAGQNTCLFDEETLDDVVPSTGLYDAARCVALSPDGRHVAAGGANASGSWMWDLATGKGRQRESRNHLLTVGFSPDGTKMFQGGQDLWFPLLTELNDKPVQPTLKETSVRHIHGAAMTPDGRFLLASFVSEDVALWDLRTGDAVRHFKPAAPSPQVQVSPKGRTMLTTSPYQLWDLDTQEKLHSWPAPAHFLPDGRILVLEGAHATVYAVDGKTVRADGKLPLNTEKLQGCVVSQNGKRLVGVGGGAIQVLDVASGAEVWKWHRPWWPFVMLAYQLSPDGRYLLTANSDGTVYVLRLPE